MSSYIALAGPGAEAHASRVAEAYEHEAARLALPGLALPTRKVDVVHVSPWLFADVTASLDDAQRTSIAVSALLYRDYLLAFDPHVDGEKPVDAALLLAAGLWHERAITKLGHAVPHTSSFWSVLARLARTQVAAVADERNMARAGHNEKLWTFESFAALAAAKAAVLTAIPAACCAAQQSETLVDAWGPVMAPFSVSEQIRDDLEDWREDWLAGRITYAHVRALSAGGLLDAMKENRAPDVDTVGHHLFHSGVAEELLADAIEACETSGETAKELGAHAWARVARFVGSHCEELAAKVKKRRTKAATHATQPLTRRDTLEAVGRALVPLEREHALGYPEASHRMRFVNGDGPQMVRPVAAPADGVHEGLVFTRAIIGWFYALCERNDVAMPNHLIDENLDALFAFRLPVENHWNYHPTIAALPPDIDDLAQVLHAHLARPARDLEGLFRHPVALAFENQQANGAMETFYIDPALSDDWKEWYEGYKDKWVGRGFDAEVVANLGSAVLAWKPGQYMQELQRLAEFVTSRQDESGGWSSPWYLGSYYGTFASSRFLSAITPRAESCTIALREAKQFLLTTQRADGGWGVHSKSDAQSTAVAVLALSYIADRESDSQSALARGARWLLLAQRPSGLWTTEEAFVAYDFNMVTPELGVRPGAFKSNTVTTAFAAAALLEAGAGFDR